MAGDKVDPGFGTRIKDLRREAGFTTQSDFEYALKSRYGPGRGPSRGTIQNWEGDKSLPKADDLVMLADFFGCSTDYLLGLVEGPASTPPAVADDRRAAAAVEEAARGLPGAAGPPPGRARKRSPGGSR